MIEHKFIDKRLLLILISGFIIRILFLLFGAEIYYGKPDYYIGGDTQWWVSNIVNLIEHGSYTNELNNEWGYFTRTPGYSFFIGIFYLITGKNIDLALKLVIIVQSVLDIFSIFFIYKITQHIFQNYWISIIAAFLYSFYPFIIVWNVVVHAESFSVFLFLASIYYFLNSAKPWEYFLSGAVFSLAVLTRIQLIVFIPFFVAIAAYKNYLLYTQWLNKNVLLFVLSIILIYGAWPARNIIIHGKPVFAQNLGGKWNWSPDYMAYMDYIWAVKTDHEPQLTQILSDSVVEFPEASYKIPTDSVLLKRVIFLARTCGEGFSYFARSKGLRNDVVLREDACNEEIAQIFNKLVQNQKKHNTINYYLLVPLSNLHKALFKSALMQASDGNVYYISKALFLYRTTLILLGIISIILMYFFKRNTLFSPGFLIIITYPIAWYFFQSFVYRNMEIRFLLHADILLLIPASFLLFLLIKKSGLIKDT